MLFPDKKLVGITVREPRINVALTDELKAKGSISVTFKYDDFKYDDFKYDEVSK